MDQSVAPIYKPTKTSSCLSEEEEEVFSHRSDFPTPPSSSSQCNNVPEFSGAAAATAAAEAICCNTSATPAPPPSLRLLLLRTEEGLCSACEPIGRRRAPRLRPKGRNHQMKPTLRGQNADAGRRLEFRQTTLQLLTANQNKDLLTTYVM